MEHRLEDLNSWMVGFLDFRMEAVHFRKVQNQKEPCRMGQDSFTRTLYENEKITFRINYIVNVPPVFPQMKLLL